jgi:non-heme chloroperoxidase
MFLSAAAASTLVSALPRTVYAKSARSVRVRAQDGTPIYVKDWGGSGLPVILTHAWPLSADIWDGPAAALSEAGYRVVAHDRRGFGRSGKPAAGFDFDTFSDDLAAVIRQLKLRDAALIG